MLRMINLISKTGNADDDPNEIYKISSREFLTNWHQAWVKAYLVCQPIMDDDEVPKLVALETFKAATEEGHKS
nr:hypothetical protein [Tanacetum cinerariifolium]